MSTSRRDVLGGAIGALAALSLPLGSARADVARRDLKFLFVMCYGGWDTTRVFLPHFGNPAVSMEADAAPWTVGGLSLVDHPGRPAVRSFFEAHHARSLVVNGLLVPSVAHPACLRLALTGTTADGQPDWAARIAASHPGGYAVPQLVVGGPSFPGPHGAVVSRTGGAGQLSGLLDGSILERGEVYAGRFSPEVEVRLQQAVSARGEASALHTGAERDQALAAAWSEALSRADALKQVRDDVDWTGGRTFADQAGLAVGALAVGACRVASVSFVGPEIWDSHYLNDDYQAVNFQALFSALEALMVELHATPGQAGATLADETVVVVLSEMGRSPALNSSEGKDHWPFTSALLVGPGLTGDRVLGGQDDLFYGERIDPVSGEVDPAGVELHAQALGATLLALADGDPEAVLPGVPVIEGVLA